MDRDDILRRLEDRYTPVEIIEILDLPFTVLYDNLEDYIIDNINELDIGDLEYASDET